MLLKGLEKTIIDLSHTNESESTPKDTREINEIDLSDRGQIEKVETDNMGPEKTETALVFRSMSTCILLIILSVLSFWSCNFLSNV
jgi:hypothetical protein